jgi:hypothetical protein
MRGRLDELVRDLRDESGSPERADGVPAQPRSFCRRASLTHAAKLSISGAAKAGMDALAVSYAGELARFGVETCIIVPGSFTSGTNHFAHSDHPADESVVDEYETLYPKLMDQVAQRLADQAPADADVADVATAIVDVVDMPSGTRPFRVHIDPADDGAAVVSAVADRMRVEFLGRIGLEDLLHPHVAAAH